MNKIYIILKYYKVFRVFYKFVLLIINCINYHIDNNICYINDDNDNLYIIICIAGSLIFISLIAGIMIHVIISKGWEDSQDFEPYKNKEITLENLHESIFPSNESDDLFDNW